jgi:hypothetical protein
MVLWLKPWESRSLPGLQRTEDFLITIFKKRRFLREAAFFVFSSQIETKWPARG